MERTYFHSLCWLILFIAFVAPVLVGNAMAAEKVLKIGTTLPLSGPAAEWGLGFSRMNEFFAEDVNARGGLKIGDDVYKIQTITYDCKAQPAQAEADAGRLVREDNVQYLVGGVIAATGLAVLPSHSLQK